MSQCNNGPRVVIGTTVILLLNLHLRWLLPKRKEQYPFCLPVIKYQTHQRSEAEASLGWAAYNEQNSIRSQGQRVTFLGKAVKRLAFFQSFHSGRFEPCFPGGSDGKESTCNMGDPDLFPESGRSPRKGNGYPFQYSCLENAMDCIVHGVAKSRT